MKKQLKLRKEVKEILIGVICVIAIAFLWKVGSDHVNDQVEDCINAGNSRYYCESHLKA